MKNLPLKGTEFQVKVWKEISKFRMVKLEHKDLAIALENPTAQEQ